MKKLIALTVMVTCAFAPIVNAAGPGNGPGRQHQQKWYQSGPGHDDRRAPQQHNNRQNGYGNGDHYGKSGASRSRDYFSWQGRDYRKGQPAPERFRAEKYRINDWRHYDLYQPPSGHYWTRIDGNYVLIAAATGVIAGILLGNALN